MQNAQNTEIQQRVINLVELYRTKVGKESLAAKELEEEYKRQCDDELDFAFSLHEQGVDSYVANIKIPEDAIDAIRVNEQLLGYFYRKVAGSNADERVLTHFLEDKYNSSIFSDEEEAFLLNHFAEMVNYIIHTPNNDLSAVKGVDRNDLYLLPQEVLKFIVERVVIPSGSKIYNPFTGFAQFANLYKGCSFICEESYMPYFKKWNSYCDRVLETDQIIENKVDEGKLYAWMMVALYANSIDAKVIEDGKVPAKYDSVLSFIPRIPKAIPGGPYELYHELPDDPEIVNKMILAYKNLPEGGHMILVLPKDCLWASNSYYSLRPLWEEMIKDKSLAEIIQLPAVMSYNADAGDYSVVIAEKGRKESVTTIIDARFASKEITNDNVISMNDLINGKGKEFVGEGIPMRTIAEGEEVVLLAKNGKSNFIKALDINELKAAEGNGGKEAETGLRKIVKVESSSLNVDLLVPQVYVVETPLRNEAPVPLSTLCTMVNTHVRDIKYNLPNETPWIREKNLSYTYQGELDLSHPDVDKAECPNIPPHTDDYVFDENGELDSELPWSQKTEIGNRVVDYRNCYYLDGKKDAVLFKFDTIGPRLAIVRATQRPLAVDNRICVFVPNAGVDAFRLYVLLSMPLVYRQIRAIKDFGLAAHLDDILVPTDKRLIYDEIHKMERVRKLIDEMRNDYEDVQKKHLTKLENYQHTMRNHIREIGSDVRRMIRYIEEMNYSIAEKEYLIQRLNHISEQKGFLSEDIERLNEENTYGAAKPYDIDHCIKGYVDYFGEDVCPIHYSNEIAKESVKNFQDTYKENLRQLDKDVKKQRLNRVYIENSAAFVDIAEYNFGKIVRNILENAKKHGFKDFNAPGTNERKVEILLSWDDSKQMYRIDFRNNGEPLTDGFSKDIYGEFRKYAGKTGGSGIGGYEIAETVKYYSGDYSISQEGDWVVVSIFLPKSKSYEQERV